MKSSLNRQKQTLGLIGLSLVMSILYCCSGKKASNGNSKLWKEINDRRILNTLTDRYLSKLNATAQADFHSSALVVNLELDSMAELEAFRSFWLTSASYLRGSDSAEYVFYDSVFKIKLSEHTMHKHFPDSIRFYKTQINKLASKLDSAKRGLFGNPVLEQFLSLSNEKGNVYFLSAELKYKDDQSLKLYFGIEELKRDTIIGWTTKNSLAAYMRTAVFRRNSAFWTRELIRPDTIKSHNPRKV